MSRGEVALVTGAAGFIGSRVCLELVEKGFTVETVGRSWRDDPLTEARLRQARSDVSLVVHCAGTSSVGQSVATPHADFERTVVPTAALLDWMRTRAVAARLVLLSSAAVYGAAEKVPTLEETPLAPISPYGVHKQICEQLCDSYGRLHGLSIAVIRFFSVYGPGLRKQLFWDACQKARSGDVQFAGSGVEVRDWIHIDDAASLILAASRFAAPDVPRINGGSGIGTAVGEAVRSIFEQMGAASPVFTGGGRPGDPKHYVADITRARSLGWVPTIALERGIREYVTWFKGQK